MNQRAESVGRSFSKQGDAPRLEQSRFTLAVVVVILLVQAGIALYVGLPGQLSADSVVQLYEGRTHRFFSFNPPLMSILLGALDRVGSGPFGFVLISQALLSAATYAAITSAKRPQPLALIVAAVLVLNPVMLIYAGIVWKDVLLAHAVALTYLIIARHRERHRTLSVSFSLLVLLLLTLIVGVRQQGVLFALPAAIWAATLARTKAAVVCAALIFALAPLAVDKSVNLYAQSRSEDRPDATTGWRILMHFDLAAIAALGGELSAKAPAAVIEELRNQSTHYDPTRVDTLTGPAVQYGSMTFGQMSAIWLDSILKNPGAYLEHRGRHFLALIGAGNMRRCLPVHTGIADSVHVTIDGARTDLVAALGLRPGPTRASHHVFDFVLKWGNTPLFKHFVYALALAALLAWLVRRREYVLATLAVCSLLFVASYFVVGIACDFRYAYTLTVTTSLLTAYCAVNAQFQPWRSRHAQSRGDSSS